MAADRRYWDANVFLGWLLGESDKVAACQGVLDAAESGTVYRAISADYQYFSENAHFHNPVLFHFL